MPMFENGLSQSARETRCPDCASELVAVVWYSFQKRFNLSSGELLEALDAEEIDSWDDTYVCDDCGRDCTLEVVEAED